MSNVVANSRLKVSRAATPVTEMKPSEIEVLGLLVKLKVFHLFYRALARDEQRSCEFTAQSIQGGDARDLNNSLFLPQSKLVDGCILGIHQEP